MSYKIIKNFYGEQIQRTSDGAYIPEDPLNRDYVEYKKWVDSGNNRSWMIRYASTDIGTGWSFFYSTDGSNYTQQWVLTLVMVSGIM